MPGSSRLLRPRSWTVQGPHQPRAPKDQAWECYRLASMTPPPAIPWLIPGPQCVMTLGRASGRKGVMEWGPMDGISALVGTPTEHCPLRPCKDTARLPSVNLESAGTLALDFQAQLCLRGSWSVQSWVFHSSSQEDKGRGAEASHPPASRATCPDGVGWASLGADARAALWDDPPTPSHPALNVQSVGEPGGACGRVSQPCGPWPGLGRHSPPGPPSPQTSDFFYAGP